MQLIRELEGYFIHNFAILGHFGVKTNLQVNFNEVCGQIKRTCLN